VTAFHHSATVRSPTTIAVGTPSIRVRRPASPAPNLECLRRQGT
jgi:hypothetical protein